MRIITFDRPVLCSTFTPDSSNTETLTKQRICFQKKLSDYFRLLVSQGDMLKEFYEPAALMRSDEANLISALLTSLNVVDCNLCVKVRRETAIRQRRRKIKAIF